MPLNGWSFPNFKLIGDSWGEFIKMDDDTLHERSFDKGRILIVTDQVQRISGTFHMEILGRNYSVRIEEDASFRTITSDAYITNSQSLEPSTNPGNGLENPVTRKDNDTGPEEKRMDESKNDDGVVNTDDVQEMEVVDETSDLLINKAVADVQNKDEVRHYDDNNLQMVVFQPSFMSWKHILQSQNMLGNSKVGSPKAIPTIEKHISNHLCSSNSINVVETSKIDSPKTNNLADNYDEDNFSSWSELPFNSKLIEHSKKKATAEKIKKRKKTIEELIGFPKSKKGGRKIKKGVLVRSAIASAALSISSEGFRNRNRLILNEEEAALSVSKNHWRRFFGGR